MRNRNLEPNKLFFQFCLDPADMSSLTAKKDSNEAPYLVTNEYCSFEHQVSQGKQEKAFLKTMIKRSNGREIAKTGSNNVSKLKICETRL